MPGSKEEGSNEVFLCKLAEKRHGSKQKFIEIVPLSGNCRKKNKEAK